MKCEEFQEAMDFIGKIIESAKEFEESIKTEKNTEESESKDNS